MEFETAFAKLLQSHSGYQEALKLVQTNSSGKVWLIGGFLSRNLANILYSTGSPEGADFDFVVEKINTKPVVPNGWTETVNRYGNPKLVRGQTEVDIVPLNSIASIQRRKLAPTIDNWLTGTPLTIQSLGYDIEAGKIFGDIGLEALRSKTVGINNRESALNNTRIKGIEIDDLVKRVATSFSFAAKL